MGQLEEEMEWGGGLAEHFLAEQSPPETPNFDITCGCPFLQLQGHAQITGSGRHVLSFR